MAAGHDHNAMMSARQHEHHGGGGGDEEGGMQCSMSMIVSPLTSPAQLEPSH